MQRFLLGFVTTLAIASTAQAQNIYYPKTPAPQQPLQHTAYSDTWTGGPPIGATAQAQ